MRFSDFVLKNIDSGRGGRRIWVFIFVFIGWLLYFIIYLYKNKIK